MFDDEGIFQLRDEHHQALSGCRGRCPSLPLRLGSVVRPSLPRSALGFYGCLKRDPQGMFHGIEWLHHGIANKRSKSLRSFFGLETNGEKHGGSPIFEKHSYDSGLKNGHQVPNKIGDVYQFCE